MQLKTTYKVDILQIFIGLSILVVSCSAFYKSIISITVLLYYCIMLGTTALILCTKMNVHKYPYRSLSLAIWVLVHIFIAEFLIDYNYSMDIAGVSMNVTTFQLLVLFCVFTICNHIQETDKYDSMILKITAISFIVNFFFTYRALLQDPTISKFMATGQVNESNTFGVVGYGYIYGILFIIPFILSLYHTESRRSKKNEYVVVLAAVIFFIYVCGYFTAMILTILACLLFYIFRVNIYAKFILGFICICLTFLMFDLVAFADFLIMLSENIEVFTISERIKQIAVFIKFGNMGDTLDRFDLYQDSISSFLNSPIIGNAILGNNYEISGHSEILDILANGGIILFTIFYMCIHQNFKVMSKLCSQKSDIKTALFIVNLLFVVLNLINTSFSSGFIYLFIFGISPALIRKYNSLERN